MTALLDAVEARVLGALVEKEITTPEYYPLSLNALVNACNQKSNRDPEMQLDESAVRSALRALDEKALARSAATDSRVAKYEHQLQEAYNFTRPEIAVLCELLLRGPQTPGELRSRASRLHAFEDLSVVHSTLQRLMHRDPPLATLLARQPGTKEARYAQLLTGEPTESAQSAVGAPSSGDDDRIARSSDFSTNRRLEEEIASLKQEIADLKQQFANFRKQFE